MKKSCAAAALRVVLCTVPSKEVGKAIATKLLTDGLCACVNSVPGVESMYRWNG